MAVDVGEAGAAVDGRHRVWSGGRDGARELDGRERRACMQCGCVGGGWADGRRVRREHEERGGEEGESEGAENWLMRHRGGMEAGE